MGARYDYRCEACGRVGERVLPMSSNPRRKLRCTEAGCGGKCVRLISGGVQVNEQRVSNTFPYVSNRLPFKLEGEPTEPKLGRVVVQDKAHKDRLYREHGFRRE